MTVAVVKDEFGVRIVQFRGASPKTVVNYLPSKYTVADTKFLVETPDGKYKVCEKKKSQWLKDQIKNAVSE